MAKLSTPLERRKWKPRQKCIASGQYAAYQQSRKFGKYRYAHQITMVEGHHFPPHGEGKVYYILSDRTRHEGDK